MEFQLIIKKIKNSLSLQEEAEFQEWYNEAEEHRAFFHRVAENYSNGPMYIDKNKAWNKSFGKISNRQKKKSKTRFAVAAVLTVALISIFLLDYNTSTYEVPTVVETSGSSQSQQIILTLENGENIPLESRQNRRKIKDAEQRGSELLYSGSDDSESEIAYNSLTIPRGEKFTLHLSDGTRIWLNADTRIKFPVDFKENAPRVVELIYGEAYFEVTTSRSDSDNFFVKTGSQTIEVLGTEFNVRAYLEDSTIETVLAEGKIDLIHGNKEKTRSIKPGYKSVYNKKGRWEIVTVDVENETSWRKGIFRFENMELKEIMLAVSRWYDVDVQFNDPAMEKKTFNGIFRKSQDLNNILSLLKKTGEVEYRYENQRTIIIR